MSATAPPKLQFEQVLKTVPVQLAGGCHWPAACLLESVYWNPQIPNRETQHNAKSSASLLQSLCAKLSPAMSQGPTLHYTNPNPQIDQKLPQVLKAKCTARATGKPQSHKCASVKGTHGCVPMPQSNAQMHKGKQV